MLNLKNKRVDKLEIMTINLLKIQFTYLETAENTTNDTAWYN